HRNCYYISDVNGRLLNTVCHLIRLSLVKSKAYPCQPHLVKRHCLHPFKSVTSGCPPLSIQTAIFTIRSDRTCFMAGQTCFGPGRSRRISKKLPLEIG